MRIRLDSVEALTTVPPKVSGLCVEFVRILTTMPSLMSVLYVSAGKPAVSRRDFASA